VAWLGTKTELVRFEELTHHLKNLDTKDAEAYFAKLLRDCAVPELPNDWRERVLVGSDRKQSGTARENLTGNTVDLPNELPDVQKRLVDVAVPGFRKILGYE
jgi:hypothetical protein